jgi:hypothetical protein
VDGLLRQGSKTRFRRSFGQKGSTNGSRNPASWRFPGHGKAGLCYCLDGILARTVKILAPILQKIDLWRSSPASGGFPRVFSLLLLALFAFSGISRAETPKPASNATPNRSAAVRTAIDDFDGDFHPDQIAVKTGANEFSGTQYWIEVRLSTAPSQIIPVFSVPGGIQVVARDVNGNGSLDLVLTASSLRRPVAILLNDGHGVFTRVDPDEFPRAFQESETTWESRAHFLDDFGGLPRSLRFFIALAPGELWVAPSAVARLTAENSTSITGRALAPHAGRAPPASFLL